MFENPPDFSMLVMLILKVCFHCFGVVGYVHTRVGACGHIRCPEDGAAVGCELG